ncbi:MAG: S41 family peptidase [Bacteroidia bacterium]
MNKYIKWQPFIYAVLIAAGIGIGIYLKPAGNIRAFVTEKSKINEILNIINQAYVDTVNREQLEEKSIHEMLSNLDPHSVYIPARDLEQANEHLEGNFEGIGVEFSILKDTIMVVSALNGGPSQELGIRAGDRIITVEGKSVANVKINNEKVFKLLRGPHGTKVNIEIYRPDEYRKIPYTITRGTIPILSVDVILMLNERTGYIKISSFAKNTHQEFVDAVVKLKQQNMQNLIVDLRGNPGGFLNSATEIADEFLDDKKIIVYTEGRRQGRIDYKGAKEGKFETGKLILLIDEGSASASEILSGAVQDWDRGIVIGRRSFGKGLVQEPFEFRDGSALRLTVARYYTPSGRCIQKTYKDGYSEYEHEVYKRFEDGELQDSTKIKSADSIQYFTSRHRIVHGGGGITPDIFVPLDTSFSSAFLNRALSNGWLSQFAYAYNDKHRKALKKFKNETEFSKGFSENLVNEFVLYAKTKNLIPEKEEIKRSSEYIGIHLKALVARQIWRDQGYFTVLNSTDKTVKKALQALENYESILNRK